MTSPTRHFTIPLFIPMQGCPFACVFCNQRNITGQHYNPSDADIADKIKKHLLTIPKQNCIIEVGFFGGSFTGLPLQQQKHYLSMVQPWLKNGMIHGIRLSTRPDYINHEILEVLKDYGVSTIELGAQSLDDEVLKIAGRGHTSKHVREAAAMVKAYGFSLGLQMMLGLPGDTIEKSVFTAKEIIAMGADSTRIYPTLVVRNTILETSYLKGEFRPLSLNEAIDWCSAIVPLFEEANVKILRVGLHPGEGFLHGTDLVAGPFHVAFGEMVRAEIWKKLLVQIPENPSAAITVFVNPKQINVAVGHGQSNRKFLEKNFRNIRFSVDPTLTGRKFYVDYH